MAYVITKRCNRCLKVMRNDGTEQNPKWVCNNPKCVKYAPPQPEPEPTSEPTTPTEDTTTEPSEEVTK